MIAGVLGGLAGPGAPRPARAEREGTLGIRDPGWDGLSGLISEGAELGIAIETPDRIDLEALDPTRDALLLVHPTVPLPTRGLADFLQRGGRLAVADDFGRADTFLAAYDIERRVPQNTNAQGLRRNPALPVGRALYDHPLTQDVGALVANHPAVVRHPELTPLIALDGSEDALVLTGAVGEGRLVVLADPSVLINNMRALRGNRAFARNLLAYLEEGRGGRLFVAGGATPIVGDRPEHGGSGGLERLADVLGDLARADLPPAALRVLYVTLAVLFLFFVAATTPRRSPYRVERMLPSTTPRLAHGPADALFARRGARLLHPTLVYADELTRALAPRLGIARDASPEVLSGALERSGLSEADRADARWLLDRLAAVRAAAARGETRANIGRAELRRMVDTGEGLLARLEPPAEKE